MSLYLNTSDSSGIPEYIYQAIRELSPEFTGNWLASLISDQPNDEWEAKLSNEHGQKRISNIRAEQQTTNGVQRAFRQLREAFTIKK